MSARTSGGDFGGGAGARRARLRPSAAEREAAGVSDGHGGWTAAGPLVAPPGNAETWTWDAGRGIWTSPTWPDGWQPPEG